MRETTAAVKNEVKSNCPMWMSTQPKRAQSKILPAPTWRNRKIITSGVLRTTVT